ncbi:uncharacterized protein TNCV_265931 [Trichonephila clavipes]|nr:uncharacterized protein TNCV_265931 [Trichonephila clavipes]
MTWTTPELAPPLLTPTRHQREDVSALDRFNVHRCPTRWVFSGTGIELVTNTIVENKEKTGGFHVTSYGITKISETVRFSAETLSWLERYRVDEEKCFVQ